MSVLVAGKRPPDPDALEDAATDGFEYVELYLERSHLDTFEETLSVCQQAAVDVVSVHTPHVALDEAAYFQQANDLADALDALLVVHSSKTNLVAIPEILRFTDFTEVFGFENSTGHSEFHIVNAILEADHELVLDTAHLYTAEQECLRSLERLVTDYGDCIPLVHCCDGTRLTDGLPFGTGTMDMEAVVSRLNADFHDGIIVLEVPPEHQAAALDRYESYIGTRQGTASDGIER